MDGPMPSSDKPPAPPTKGPGQEEQPQQSPDDQGDLPPEQSKDTEFGEVTM